MNAADLLNMRQAGKRPAGVVIATLVPELNRYTPAVTLHRSDDLAGFYGLDILLAFASPQAEAAIDLIDRLLPLKPNSLNTWVLDTGVLVAVVENGVRHITTTLPNPALGALVEEVKCA